ncbi:MAG: hypothetical protein JNN17_10795 [Verrucomicrobiaceae bacterium]|nr:hypothetical protein [Verrucomicrobiaceae bacterium]
MKRLLPLLLTLSLLANAVLGWLASQPGSIGAIPGPSEDAGTSQRLPATPALPPPSPVLDWRSLEAPDFATYIANLRRAGCPEATIRHLIEPELHAVFETRRQNTAAHASTPSSQADEAATLAALLKAPEPTPPAEPVSASNTASSFASIPAAFLVGNAAGDSITQDGSLSPVPTDASLSPETLQTLADMRQKFGDQVTASGSDPSSREFYLQWLKAQRQSDDYFASLYGGDHFISVQQQANLQRSQNGSSNAAQVTKSSN